MEESIMVRRRKNNTIKSYTLHDGSERFQFQLYTGVNPKSGKKTQTRRRGFNSYEAGDAAYNVLLAEIDNGT